MVHPSPTPFPITECPYLSLLLADLVLCAVRFSISVFRAHGSIVGDCAFNMNRSRLLSFPSFRANHDGRGRGRRDAARESLGPSPFRANHDGRGRRRRDAAREILDPSLSEPTMTDLVDADATLLGPRFGASCCEPPPRRSADEDFCTPEQSVLDLLVGEPR